MPTVAAQALTVFTSRLLEALGTPATAARRVAQHIIDADLTGHESHGVLRLEQYCRQVREGYVDPRAQPDVARAGAVSAVVDGRSAWGPIAGDFAVETALAMAREHAVGIVSLVNAHHLGRLGPYPEKAARQGFIGIVFCNVHGSARMAPWGGTERRLSTNPIAFAIPARPEPIVADLATSAVAEGKVRLAKIKGEKVPVGWVLDADGNWSDDPEDLYGSGSLAPLGGDQGHKGYSLAVAMDLLGGVLSGAGSGLKTERYGNGVLLQVIDPAAFTDPHEYAQRIDAYIAYLRSSRRRSGIGEIMMPGEIERRRRVQRLRSGIDVAEGVWRMLGALAVTYGLELER